MWFMGPLQQHVVVKLSLVNVAQIIRWELYPIIVVQDVGQKFRLFDFLYATWFELHRSDLAFLVFSSAELCSPGPFCPLC